METAKRIVVSAASIFRDGKATRIHSAVLFSNLVGGLKVLFGLFFTVVALSHIAMQPSGCDEIWSKGCENKIPFCNKVFTPSCNCASLKIENNKSLVTLPDSLVDDMQDLRKVFIRNCNLTALPPRMETLTEMVDFEVSFNRLQRFDVDVSKWERLETLLLNNNNITAYNDAIFTHDNLAYLDLSDNIELKPEAKCLCRRFCSLRLPITR